MNELFRISFCLSVAILTSTTAIAIEAKETNGDAPASLAAKQRLGLHASPTFGAVLFRSDSAVIEQALWSVLRGAIALATKYPDLIIELEGHADVRGSRNHNRNLSLKRVQSVAEYFTRHGISSNRIKMRAHGESRASANVNDPNGHIFDRRVTVTLNYPDTSA